MRTKVMQGLLTALTCVWASSSAAAQQATSGIAGLVKDASGAVLPGVTVEAASPALIEKVRTAVTDGEGRYNLISLAPGTYTVTFTLTGFNTVKHEGILLTAGFTAQVNADLPVGALAETLTVTGDAPLVDTQNNRQQSQISADVLNLLPTSKAAVNAVIALTPGVSGQADVGRSSGVWVSEGTSATITFHGKTGLNMNYDGFGIVAALGNGNTGYLVNPMMVQEIVVEKGGGTAETNTSALTMNAVPKEGSNQFNFNFNGNYSNHFLQSNNLDSDLRDRGVTSVDSARYLYTAGFSAGGPVVRDKLWFLGSAQGLGNYNYVANNYFNKTQGTPFYTPDFTRPADQLDESSRFAIRTTWQASARNKVNGAYELQHIDEHRRRINGAPEASINYRHKSGIIQGAWNSPVTSKLLLEAGAGVMFFNFPTYPQPEVTDPATFVSILEASTNYRYNAQTSYTNPEHNERRSERFAISYVTGSHAFKSGIQMEQHLRDSCAGCNGPQPNINYTFNNQVPTTITENATPYLVQNRTKLELGLFAQDQWTVKRFTVNYGVRFDYFDGYVPAQSIPATRFLAQRSYAEVDDVPRWTDLDPRVGVSFDLFGNGRTALKASVGRYLIKETFQINNALNPLNTSVNSVTRTWTDTNKDYVPNCDLTSPAANGECGPISNAAFGQPTITTQYANDVLHGFGVRPHDWDVSAEIQHELTHSISITGGWYRSVFSDPNSQAVTGAAVSQYVTQNLTNTPADWSPFCITAPSDPRLPGGGNYQVCGLYDLNPNRFGVAATSVVDHASKFGNPQNYGDFVSLTTGYAVQVWHVAERRRGHGSRRAGQLLRGQFTAGPLELPHLDAVGSPDAAQGAGQLSVAGSLRRQRDTAERCGSGVRGELHRDERSDFPSLGRNLSACGTRTLATCTATATVPLIAPGQDYEPRRTQLDLRLTKMFKFATKNRLQVNFDLFNALNSSAVINVNSAYGPAWRQAGAGGTGSTSLAVLAGRLAQFSVDWKF